jgi:hypothetical protein
LVSWFRCGTACVRLVLVIEQINDEMLTANVELIRDGDGVIASATMSAFDDPIFQPHRQWTPWSRVIGPRPKLVSRCLHDDSLVRGASMGTA